MKKTFRTILLTALAALTLCVGALAAAPASDLRFEEMDGTVRLCWDGVVDEDHVSYDIYFLEEGEWYGHFRDGYSWTDVEVVEAWGYDRVIDGFRVDTLVDGEVIGSLVNQDLRLEEHNYPWEDAALSGTIQLIGEDMYRWEVSGYPAGAYADVVVLDDPDGEWYYGLSAHADEDGVVEDEDSLDFFEEHLGVSAPDLDSLYVQCSTCGGVVLSADGSTVTFDSYTAAPFKLENLGGGGAPEYSGQCGAGDSTVYWNLDTGTGVLTISGEGAMADWDVYAENYAPWDVAYDQVRTVVVEEGVTSVGHSAFAFYENITRVELPQSLESIGGCAFMGLPLLESITIPAAVASIGEEAFVASVKDGFAVAEGSEHFKAVDGVLFTADGTELVAYPGNKGGLYHVPEGTERIRCGAFTDAQVEGVALYDGMKELEAGAFQNCAAMTEMIFPVTLERIGDYAFYGCESLTTIWYDGSEEQWNEIAIGGDNECLLRATIDFRLGGEDTDGLSGTCGENISWTLDLESGTLTFSGRGEMIDFQADSEGNVILPWDAYIDQLKHVVIEEGVTSIGDNAFAWCHAIETVKIPEGVTRIGHAAFWSCENMTEAKFPKSLVAIEDGAFGYCMSLEEIVLPENVTTVGNSAFLHCHTIKSMFFPESVTSMGSSVLSDCYALEEVKLPSSMTKIPEGFFEYCVELKAVELPENVTSIEWGAFFRCTSLKELHLPAGVKQIASMAFYLCDGLETINIPDGVTTIEMMTFDGCGSLKKLELPDSVTEIKEMAFAGCSSLKEFRIPTGMTIIPSNLFSNCYGLEKVVLHENVTSIGFAAFSYCTNLREISIPVSVTEIAGYAFEGCASLTTVELPENVVSIGGRAFDSCYRLAYVGIPESVTSIGEDAFRWCDALEGVYYRGGASDWEAIAIGEGNERLLEAELSCNGEALPEVPWTDTVKGYCDGDEKILWSMNTETGVLTISGEGAIPDVDYGMNALPWDLFDGQIEKICILPGITGIGMRSLNGYWNLKDVEIADTVTVIGDSAFDESTSLESVKLPENIQSIGAHSFSDCIELAKIYLPVSLTEIGKGAFNRCEELTDIYYAGTEEQWKAIAVGEWNECLADAQVHYNWVEETPAVSGTVSGGAGASVAIKGEGVHVEVQEDGSFVINGSGTFDVVICKPGCLTVTVKGVTTENGDVVLPEVQMVAGDVNGDDKINISDMGAFRQEFGKVGGNIANTLTDVNGDGKVNIADMGIFRQNFGKTAEKDCTIQYA